MKTFFAVSMLAAWAAMVPAQAAERLTPQQIEALAPGSYKVSVYGLVKLQINFQRGGAISGINSKNKRDTGTWSVQGEKLCIRWNRWLKGKTRCAALSGGNGTYSGGGLYIRKI